MKQLNDKVEEMEAKHKQEMSSMEQKFKILLRNVINENNSGLDVHALAAMLSTPGTSTSTHVPNNDEENQLDDNSVLNCDCGCVAFTAIAGNCGKIRQMWPQLRSRCRCGDS